jgi:Recombination endonuclease VII
VSTNYILETVPLPLAKAVSVSNKRRTSEAKQLAELKGELTYVSLKPCKQGHQLNWVNGSGCVECGKVKAKLYKEAHQTEMQLSNRNSWRLQTYGVTPVQYQIMYDEQKGLCAACGDPLPKVPHLDHCHRTNKPRGITCRSCNIGMGYFNDSPERLRKAAAYLEKHG